MTSKTVAALLDDLGVTRSHSRPKVSNDNPYSEAWFKTLKYAPVFPERFGALADARTFLDRFVGWYNHEHHHTGIGLHTPADVHLDLPQSRPTLAPQRSPKPEPHTRLGSPPTEHRKSLTCPRPPGSTHHRRKTHQRLNTHWSQPP